MAISIRSAGTVLFGAASITPLIPASQAVGDMMLLMVHGKPFDAAWTVPGAWTSLGTAASGSTAAGIDLGSMKSQIWYREALADPETDPLVTEGTPVWNVIGAVVDVYQKDAGETWAAPVAVFGADETSGTAISATMASDPGVTAGDYVLCTCGINTDAMGPLTGDLTPTQTGVTFGAVTQRNEATSAIGGDMTFHMSDCAVSSGTGSAAPVLTGTGTASGGADRLEAAFIRLRVSTAATSLIYPSGMPRALLVQ